MLRVVRPGGYVAAFDFDSEGIMDHPDRALALRVAEALDAAVPNPWMGRQLMRLFRRAGSTEITIVPYLFLMTSPDAFSLYRRLTQGTLDRAVQAGQMDGAEVERWWADL